MNYTWLDSVSTIHQAVVGNTMINHDQSLPIIHD